NLDAQLRVQTRGEIKRLQQEVGTTTIYVTHDQVEAMTMGDRVVVMNAARIEQVGTPQQLYEDPANTFVAGFIGSPAMTLARYSRSHADGRSALVRDGVRLPQPDGVAVPEEVVAGVRPEHVRPWGHGPELMGPWEGRVEFVEMLGRETFVGVVCGDDTRFVVTIDGVA